jgi:7-carboxy-7-deazaguanine synthase
MLIREKHLKLNVNEIFYSIQGESSYAGRPCVFVRLTGCNLRCSYCDTQYAYNEGEEMDLPTIINKIGLYECSLVEITGGEPLLQEKTPQLVQSLLNTGYEVLLETNGSKDISVIDNRCKRIVDIKCPSSREMDRNNLDNIKRLTCKDELKFVIGDREDYLYAREFLNLIEPSLLGKIQVHFSPWFDKIEPKKLADWILSDHLKVRLNLQLHKYIWGPDQKGV